MEAGYKPFHRRQMEARGEVPTTFSYDLPQKVRSQILMIWERIAALEGCIEVLEFIKVELGVFELCSYRRVGGILNSTSANKKLNAANELGAYFVDHATDDVALTIVEALCRVFPAESMIEDINSRLRYERIGYKFSMDAMMLIRVEDEKFYNECVERALGVLSVNKYDDAFNHYLQSYVELAHGQYDNALIDLRQAVESLLKTRFDILNISYDAKKDTYSKLLQIAQDHIDSGPYKFHHFKEMIQSVGSASNAGGHGQTQGQAFNVDEIYVRFMINQAAANLLFLAEVPMKP